jgi:Cu(I)/Ag(I) efflux system membrane fusion protein
MEAPPGTALAAVVRWVLVAVMAVGALGALAYYFQWLRPSPAERAAGQVEYFCPMHPSVVQDQPGECPICSMTLVSRTRPAPGQRAAAASEAASDVTGLAAVQLSPERIQLIGVRTAPVVRQALASELRTIGYVAAREDGLAHIHTRFSGWIEQLAVAQTGEKVTKGQVLATIYSPELLTAQQELLNARRWSTHAPAPPSEGGSATSRERVSATSIDGHGEPPHGVVADLEGDARHRLENMGISAADIDELLRSGQAQRAQKIRSPVSGYVLVKNALTGLYVQPDTELFQVADLSTVWVLADVYEHEVARVRVGAPVRVAVESYPGETFTGKVRFLYPTLNPETRTLRVRLELPNRALRLRPGMFATVFIDEVPYAAGERVPRGAAAAKREGLLVPSSAVVDTGEQQYVFVALGQGRFEPRRVVVGLHADERTELRSGVREGEQVVTTANFLIDSESRLRAAIEGLASGTAGRAGGSGSACDRDFDPAKYPEKYGQCRACEIQHQGMGEMVTDCKNAIPRPWR